MNLVDESFSAALISFFVRARKPLLARFCADRQHDVPPKINSTPHRS
jgi:hypothetical protein